MYHKTLLASALTVLIAGTTSVAMGQPAASTPPPAADQITAASPHRYLSRHHDHDMRRGRSDAMRNGVIGDLRGLERLYLRAGRSKDLATLYRDVLAKSRDPRVRNYVYRHLARLQAQPANYDQAIATLRKGLDENLANEARVIAERDKMRAAWQQRHERAGATSPGQGNH